MTKLSLSALLCVAALSVAPVAAQARAAARPAARPSPPAPRPASMPKRLPGLPMVQPPVDQLGLLGQPLIGGKGDQPRQRGVKINVNPKPVPPDPATSGIKRKGKDLRKAVAKVKALKWHKGLARAKAKARAEHKPILLLQTLGSISGFA